MTKLSSLSSLSFLLFACASEVPEEESSTSESALKCPSPTEDREAFIACVKNKASQGESSSGNGGTASSSQNGGTIQIGDVNSGRGKCSSLSIRCDGNGCVCRGNGGPEQACDGSNCQAVCCP